MRFEMRWVIAGLAFGMAVPLSAQSTGMPSYNAPYRAFQRSELGGIVSFPGGGGAAYEGAYRFAHGGLDIGLRAGVWDPSGDANAKLLLGAEARQRVITHTDDFPLDGALVGGIGAALASDNSGLFIPFGISLGRRFDLKESSISIVPYAQPTVNLVFASETDLNFTLGLGGDFRLSKSFDARLSVGIGDLHGVSVAAVWVH